MIDSKTFARYAANPSAFRNDLIVDVDGIARRFGDVQDPWQRDDFAALDPALMRCNGRSKSNSKTRAYFERPRGHSKTTDLAVTCCWALAFATRPLKGYAFAADRDQAALLKDAMATIVRLNPWLGEILDVQKNLVLNIARGHPGAGGRLEIFTSDVASSYGILPDLIIADELTHWEGDGALWHSLISSAAKRSNCLLAVISNAGFADSWQWKVREAAHTDCGWIFSRLDGPRASWMTPERLDEQRRMLPNVAYMRLWENQWSSGGGDALTPEQIAAAFRSELLPMTGSERDWSFVGGVDLGLTRDGSAVVVLAIGKFGSIFSGKIRLAYAKLWRPVLGKKIDLMEVERHILALNQQFDLEAVAFDPWNCELLAQRLEFHQNRFGRQDRIPTNSEPWMREIPPVASNLREIATLVIESFTDRRLQLFPCEALQRDLLKLRVEEKPYGCRLTSPRDGEGHGDLFSAFSLALLIGHQQAGKREIVVGAFDCSGPYTTAFEREFRACQTRAEEQSREMKRLYEGGSDPFGQESWEAIMRHLGRA